MPMVVMKDGVKESSLKRSRQQDLPTPESPIRRSLIWETEREGLVRARKRVLGSGGAAVDGGRRQVGGRGAVGAGSAYEEVVGAGGHGCDCALEAAARRISGGRRRASPFEVGGGS